MLSDRAQDVFRYIVRFTKEHGFPPTLREMGEEFEISSTNGVRYFLGALEQNGYVRRNSRRSRAIEIPEPSLKRFIRNYGRGDLGMDLDEGDGIPILGRVAAGTPLLAEENVEGHLQWDETFPSREPRFALRVRGDSMIDAGIDEDDLVVVRKIDHADNGSIVVALVEDEATVKTYRRFSDRVELRAENPRYSPIVIDDPQMLRILGVVIGLVRSISTRVRHGRR